ncbi:glycosyltransferase family 1 protein [Radiomyces spectabilis]|uniref:glycosyltransferase family 1 protein n=1 Tax=Radiomyces spectabilis TaxID=64574 RepID=UPI00221F9875|nr:glycosyltransferase family 1 protein [Radiomyces spectabilis]KAI8381576.1 glycosyltransferase family 1 protein [Radiomyces spectabilis]
MSVFITVGSTGFDELIEAATSTSFLSALETLGLTRITVQYGTSAVPFQRNKEVYRGNLTVSGYAYKPSITEDIEEADIVISHAGSGTMIQTLRLPNKRLIMVVNSTLMDNHQLELASAMAEKNYCLIGDISDLASSVQLASTMTFNKFPAASPQKFAALVDHHMNFV